MIAEYLDRSSLVARMKYYEEHTTEESGEHYAYSVALREIRNAPAADVAEVVRCKDCAKHYIVLGRDMCARNAQGSEGHWIGLSATVPDGFCHRGERK